MIFCFGCGISVHLYCHGLQTPYEINNRYGMFICDICEY